jgi:hypothetical protein
MGDPLAVAPVDTSAVRSNLLLADTNPPARTGAAAPGQTGAGILGSSAAPRPVGPAPLGLSPIAVPLMGAAEKAKEALVEYQIANRNLEAEVTHIRAWGLGEAAVVQAYAHVDLLQRKAITAADVNLQAQQALANVTTDPDAAAEQDICVALAKSYVRQARNVRPIGIAENTEENLRAAIEKFH